MKIKITGRRYNGEATYPKWDEMRRYPEYQETEETEWEIDGIDLLDGYKWLAENHPDMFMGANISCENGDFACLAVPCGEWGRGNFETMDARIATAKAYVKARIREDLEKYIKENYEPDEGMPWDDYAEDVAHDYEDPNHPEF